MTIPHQPFFLVLDTNGDGTGSHACNVDGSVTPVTFKITPPPKCRLCLHRILVHLRSTTHVAAEKYGGLPPLVNGVKIEWLRHNRVIDLTAAHTIKSNADWGRKCFDITAPDFGVGDQFVQARWNFNGLGVVLEGNDEFRVIIQDDLSDPTLTDHDFEVQGHIEQRTPAPAEEDPMLARFFGS